MMKETAGDASDAPEAGSMIVLHAARLKAVILTV
jgi:hypothetical protein